MEADPIPDERMPTISELDTAEEDCPRCDGVGWVCENHPNVPWAGMTGAAMCHSGVEGCGGAGMPCPDCNELSELQRARAKEGEK